MFGRKTNDPISLILQNHSTGLPDDFYERLRQVRSSAQETLQEYTDKMLSEVNARRKDVKFEPGDLILRKRVLKPYVKPPAFSAQWVGP